MQRLLLFLLLLAILIFLPIFLTKLYTEENHVEIKFSYCVPLIIRPKAIYYKNNHTLQIFVNKNCCNTYLSVETFDETIYIKEIKNGTICRCFCTAIVNVISNRQWKNIYFEDFTGERIKINILYK